MEWEIKMEIKIIEMKKLLLVLFFVPLYLNAQVEHTYFSGIHLVTMDDDFYIQSIMQDRIVATSNFLPRYEGDYVSIMTKGLVIDSLKAESEMDAVVKSNWKANHMYKLGAETRDVLLKGENNVYYIIRYKNQ
tara:strand:- start:81 stop:479 length:399 start_codon:yes stop_codon:yes gene_type:complete